MNSNQEDVDRDVAVNRLLIHQVDMDPVLAEALSHFRVSVHAWSEAAYQRPRQVVAHPRAAFAWRKLAVGAMGMALAAGAATGVHEYHHQQAIARLAAARAAEQKRETAAERAREVEDLMAKIDSDVSREVPSAMEPLASLMTEDGRQ